MAWRHEATKVSCSIFTGSFVPDAGTLEQSSDALKVLEDGDTVVKGSVASWMKSRRCLKLWALVVSTPSASLWPHFMKVFSSKRHWTNWARQIIRREKQSIGVFEPCCDVYWMMRSRVHFLKFNTPCNAIIDFAIFVSSFVNASRLKKQWPGRPTGCGSLGEGMGTGNYLNPVLELLDIRHKKGHHAQSTQEWWTPAAATLTHPNDRDDWLTKETLS